MIVHLVVTNHRTPGDLAAFCQSVERFAPAALWSLAIVNVAPTDEDVDMAEYWADRLGADHLPFARNIGYGRACNEGARRANPDVYAFFNADVVLGEGAVDCCGEALLGQPDWGVLGPRQMDSRGRLTHAGIFGSQDQPRHRGWFSPGAGGPHSDIREDAVTVSGAAYFIRQSLWDELRCCPTYREIAPEARGAFLETPHYFEETWVSYHAAAHGKKVVYWGPTTVIHEWHRASPVGGYAEQQMPVSREIFRAACRAHGIPHD